MTGHLRKLEVEREETETTSRLEDHSLRCDELPEKRTSPLAQSLFALLFFILLFCPLADMVFHFSGAGHGRLGGVEKSTTFPSGDFWSGAFQEQLEKWLSANIGLRGAFIRTDNQIHLSVFRELRGRGILGKQNFLFEQFYLDDFNGQHPLLDEKLVSIADHVAELKTLLEARGIKFLVFFTPSKVATYPENVPSHLRLLPNGPLVYERFVKLMHERQVPVVDGVALARRMKEESRYPVFPPGAAHWSNYASCKSGELFVDKLREVLGKPLAKFHCDPPSPRERTRGIEMDLAQLANVWSTTPFEAPTQNPTIQVERSPGDYLPKLLFVGDSFLWVFFHHLEKHPIYESRDFYYYYNTHERFRRRQKIAPRVRLDRNAIDWKTVFSRDAVILELNEARIGEEGFGFVADALRALKDKTDS